MLGISCAGLLSCLFMQEIRLREDMDEQWAIQVPKRDLVHSLEAGKHVSVSQSLESGKEMDSEGTE